MYNIHLYTILLYTSTYFHSTSISAMSKLVCIPFQRFGLDSVESVESGAFLMLFVSAVQLLFGKFGSSINLEK